MPWNIVHSVSKGQHSGKVSFAMNSVMTSHTIESNILELPVEVLSIILRLLDGNSLLSAVISDSHIMHVCKGDKFLRKQLRRQVSKVKREEQLRLTNPNYGVCVIRLTAGKIFGENVNKRITLSNEKPRWCYDEVNSVVNAKLSMRATTTSKSTKRACVRL